MDNTQYTADAHKVARELSLTKRFSRYITGVEIRSGGALGGAYTNVTLHNGYSIAITTINDDYGDMFTIVAYVTPADDTLPTRDNIVKTESGPVKDLKKTLGDIVETIAKSN